MIWITNELSKQSIIHIFLYLFQFPEKIFAQFRLHLNGSPVNYALVTLSRGLLKIKINRELAGPSVVLTNVD